MLPLLSIIFASFHPYRMLNVTLSTTALMGAMSIAPKSSPSKTAISFQTLIASGSRSTTPLVNSDGAYKTVC